MLSQLPAQMQSQLVAKEGPPASRTVPSSESGIVSNPEGETLVVTLPGAKK